MLCCATGVHLFAPIYIPTKDQAISAQILFIGKSASILVPSQLKDVCDVLDVGTELKLEVSFKKKKKITHSACDLLGWMSQIGNWVCLVSSGDSVLLEACGTAKGIRPGGLLS